MGFARTLGLAGIAVALFVSPALAGDGDDAAAWLRKGKAAESIDHDPAKAIEAYRQALLLPEISAAGLSAGLRLLELYETGGDAAGALATARVVAARYAPILDEPTKDRVLDALARLLPPGSKERTPIGLVVIPGPAPGAADAEPSPLVRRFEDAFQDLVNVDPQGAQYARWRADLVEKLRPLGTDALPVLEWMIRSESLRKSTAAMELLAVAFPSQGVPLLERLALDADVLVRGPSLSALRKLPAGPAKWAALDRLRKAPALASQASSIRSGLEKEMNEDALLAEHALGGPEASAWLRLALDRGGEPALRRALEVGAQDRSLVRDWLVTLTAGGKYSTRSSEARGALEAFLRADPEAEADPQIRQGLAALAAAHVNDVPEADAAGRLAARRAAWARIADMKAPDEIVAAMHALALASVLAPPDLFVDARWTSAFVSGWLTLVLRDGEGSLSQYVELEGLSRAGPFWSELAARLLADGATAPRLLELATGAVDGKVPADLVDARWVQIAARDLSRSEAGNTARPFLATAAVLSQDPSCLALYRRAVVEGARPVLDEMTPLLAHYRGPDLLDLLTTLLGRVEREPESRFNLASGWSGLLEVRARALLTPPQVLERIRVTREREPAAAAAFLRVLGEQQARAEILTLLKEEAARTGPLDVDYAEALVQRAGEVRSSDVYPVLLRIYRDTGRKSAATQLHVISGYLAQLKTFEGWTREAEDVGSEVEASLASPDAAVRAAGVQGIVVLERRAAIARLLKLIRTEKEGSVLSEANQMLRKLSAAVLDGTPAPGAPDVHYYKELQWGPDGKPILPAGMEPPSPAAPTPPRDEPAPAK